MKYILAVTVAQFAWSLALSQELPNLACQTLEEVTIVHAESLPTRHSSTLDLYRFVDGKLFMASPGLDEYVYDDVVFVEPRRFASRFKIIMFALNEFENATEIHTDQQGTRVRRLHCVRV